MWSLPSFRLRKKAKLLTIETCPTLGGNPLTKRTERGASLDGFFSICSFQEGDFLLSFRVAERLEVTCCSFTSYTSHLFTAFSRVMELGSKRSLPRHGAGCFYTTKKQIGNGAFGLAYITGVVAPLSSLPRCFPCPAKRGFMSSAMAFAFGTFILAACFTLW